jgi:hypothetical protein
MLLQNSDDLLFRISALLHQQLPHSIYERTSEMTGRYFRGQVTQTQLQSPVLILQRLQPLRFADLRPARLLLPTVERRVTTARNQRAGGSLAQSDAVHLNSNLLCAHMLVKQCLEHEPS